jgi:multidrug efflux system membrane fusion protein
MNATQDTWADGSPRRSRMGWILGVVAAILLILIAVHIFKPKPPAKGTPPQVVKVAKATSGDMPEVLTELGTVTPIATVTVLPMLSGYLTQVGYREGQDVTKDQFLAQIDPRQFQIDLEQAEATLLKDQASLRQAHSDLARFEELRAQKAIAEQTVTDQEFLVEQDEAQVKADIAAADQFKLDLVYCHITAPVAGRVGLRLVDPGNFVTASSAPGIVVITTMKPTTVQFTVAQNDLEKVIERFNTGAKLPVTAYTSDNSRQIGVGTLDALSNQMSTSTGTVTLRATFPNDDEALFPDAFVNIDMLVDTMTNAVLVPTPAVLSGAPGDYVYLANADNTVSVRKIKPGPSDGKFTAILSGLAVGDTVVTDGTDRLSDGAKITVAAAKPTAGSAAPAAESAPAAKKKKKSGTPAQAAGAPASG